MKKGRNSNLVYSTNPDFEMDSDDSAEENLQNDQQLLKIYPDKKNRKGKTVTVVSGFVGNNDDLKSLEKKLKSLCGSGGTVKESDIFIQGNVVQKVKDFLEKEFQYVADKLDFSKEEFKEIFLGPNKTYRSYKNKRKIIFLGAKISRFLGLEKRLFR